MPSVNDVIKIGIASMKTMEPVIVIVVILSATMTVARAILEETNESKQAQTYDYDYDDDDDDDYSKDDDKGKTMIDTIPTQVCISVIVFTMLVILTIATIKRKKD